MVSLRYTGTTIETSTFKLCVLCIIFFNGPYQVTFTEVDPTAADGRSNSSRVNRISCTAINDAIHATVIGRFLQGSDDLKHSRAGGISDIDNFPLRLLFKNQVQYYVCDIIDVYHVSVGKAPQIESF